MNFGFVGLGNYSRNHLRAIQNNDELSLVSVYDVVPGQAQKVAKAFSSNVAENIESLAKDPNVDAVVITTPNAQHFADFQTCVTNGKHVFVNVPVTTNAREATDMITLAKAQNVTYMAGHNLRKNPAIVHLGEQLIDGTIGTIHSVESTVGGASAYALTADNWRYHLDQAPLLPFAQMAVVFIDLILHLMGTPENVSAFMTKRDAPGETPDHGTVISKYSDGQLAYIGCSYISQLGYEITFAGTEGKIRWDNRDDNSVTLITPGGRNRVTFDRIDEQAEELAEFSRCVNEGTTPSCGGLDAYNVAAYFDAIDRSIRANSHADYLPLN
jgi:predicted dehydrogenase